MHSWKMKGNGAKLQKMTFERQGNEQTGTRGQRQAK
jgi:hypothetical protein